MKIVDLSTDVAGQWAAKLLAMGGARVIRPEWGDRLPAHAAYLDAGKQVRPWSGPSLLDGANLVFATFDAGRRTGLADGLAIPGSCVLVTTSTFGATGPYAGFRGGPMAAWAAGGYLAIAGQPDREPLIGPEYLCEYINGYTAAIAAEAALRRRARTGRAPSVDISAMESMVNVHQTTFSRLAIGEVRKRTGRYNETYPLATVRCRDGHVLLGVVTQEEYDRFLVAMGRADLATDPRFVERAARNANRDAFDDEIAGFMQTHGANEIVEILHAYGVAAAKVAQLPEVLANPQLAHRRYWQAGRMPGNPVPAAQVHAQPAPSPGRSAMARSRSSALPLDGIVVADFSVFWAGPMATRILADMGARVIWVERPGSRLDVDPTSADPSTLTPMEFFYLKMNRHKQSMVLDLTAPEGQAAARALVAQADVLIENNRPGVMAKLGLGAEAMCAAHPRLVYVSLPGYGSSGPWSDRRSYGPAIAAASGMEARTGYCGDEPMRLGHALPDPVGGLAGALAALRGLRQREERGVGGSFDVAQLEAYTAICGEDFLLDGPLGRIGNQSRWGFTQDVFPCAGQDEWIAIRLADDKDRRAFASSTGVAWDDPQAIAGLTRNHDKFDLARRLQAAGIEAFPALNPTDLAADPQLRARDYLLDVACSDGRSVVMPGSPFGDLVQPRGEAPRFGFHTRALLEELGLA